MGALQRSLRGDPATAAALVKVRARYRECLEALRLLGQSSDGWAFAEEVHRSLVLPPTLPQPFPLPFPFPFPFSEPRP